MVACAGANERAYLPFLKLPLDAKKLLVLYRVAGDAAELLAAFSCELPKDKIRGYVRSLQLIVFGSLTDPLADRISVAD
jgi:hypothetical protein